MRYVEYGHILIWISIFKWAWCAACRNVQHFKHYKKQCRHGGLRAAGQCCGVLGVFASGN